MEIRWKYMNDACREIQISSLPCCLANTLHVFRALQTSLVRKMKDDTRPITILSLSPGMSLFYSQTVIHKRIWFHFPYMRSPAICLRIAMEDIMGKGNANWLKNCIFFLFFLHSLHFRSLKVRFFTTRWLKGVGPVGVIYTYLLNKK